MLYFSKKSILSQNIVLVIKRLKLTQITKVPTLDLNYIFKFTSSMKTIFFKPLLFTAILFYAVQNSVAQDVVEIPITGISEEVEKRLLEHDLIPTGKGLNNITLNLKNNPKKGWALNRSSIMEVKYDPSTKHYNMSGVVISVKKKSKYYTLDQPMIILVRAHTTFNNVIWTELQRTPENLTDPIVLDQYSVSTSDPNVKPVYRIVVKGDKIGSNIKDKLLPGDGQATGNALSIQARNTGGADYFGDFSAAPRKNGDFFAQVKINENVDIAKPIEVLYAIQTVNGNYIWGTESIPVSKRKKIDVSFTHYSGKPGTWMLR